MAGQTAAGTFVCSVDVGQSRHTHEETHAHVNAHTQHTHTQVSFHKYGDYFFPGTGDITDVGEHNGR